MKEKMHKTGLVGFYLMFTVMIVLVCAAQNQALADTNERFEQWVEALREEALAKGIKPQIFDRATKGMDEPIERIIELDRKQPEKTISFAQYKQRVISPARVKQGRALLKNHRALLDKVSRQYDVQPQYIVALWGIETSYGNFTGGFEVIHALATLAYDGRRSSFFRSELMDALRILQAGHIKHEDMKGSWAGAMGQNQFMPSSFHRFAVDGDKDGRRDIWTSLPDVFSSTANYLNQSGWRGDERWGREVKLPKGFDEGRIGLETTRTLEEWKTMGVRLPNGVPIPVVAGMKASLVAPDGIEGDIYLIYNNFRTLMRWNKSTYFATSVGLLADEIVQ
ncbi:MAG: lytic transglycosylase domain-containing protein [Alphaproteobacteria bacterium]